MGSSVDEDKMLNFSESGHVPCSVDPVLLSEDLCEAKEKGQLSTRTSVADMCDELASEDSLVVSHDHLRQAAQYLRSM